jgi:hypothetical protein
MWRIASHSKTNSKAACEGGRPIPTWVALEEILDGLSGALLFTVNV